MKKKSKHPVYLVLAVLLAALVFFLFHYRDRLIGQEISVYFIQDETVAPVARTIPRIGGLEEKIRQATDLLLAGPNETEKAGGFVSALPNTTRLISVSREGDVILLNFSPQIEEGGGTEVMLERLKQVVYTATQFPGIEKVRFLIDNQPIKYFSSEGLTQVENPIGRADLAMEEK